MRFWLLDMGLIHVSFNPKIVGLDDDSSGFWHDSSSVAMSSTPNVREKPEGHRF